MCWLARIDRKVVVFVAFYANSTEPSTIDTFCLDRFPKLRVQSFSFQFFLVLHSFKIASRNCSDSNSNSCCFLLPIHRRTPQVNGEAEKIDSGNETGAGEQEQEEDDITVGYDKTKSFFDNISCEAATDRKGKNRTDWRLERKLNSETFGVSSARRGG